MTYNLEELEHNMLRIRLVEESIAEKYSEQKMRCPTHLSIGQEAVSVGVCGNLSSEDFLMSTHRAHAHYLAKGGNLNAMLAEIYGKKTGCSGGMGGSMHLIDKSVGFMGSTAIVGNTIPVAVGLGMSLKIKKQEHISCVFFGDGAVEEGAFYESVNFALVHRLPVLFVCENNLYSVYSGLEVRQPKNRKIYNMAKGLGISANCGDGNKLEEVYEITRQAITKIESDEGPQLLEFSTYRWREHCGPNYDNDIGYRDEEEFLKWKEKDPLKELLLNDERLSLIKENLEKEISEAHKFAEESAFPTTEEYFKLINQT